MKISKVTQLFEGYQSKKLDKIEEKKQQDDAASVDVRRYEDSTVDRAKKIEQLKNSYQSGTLRYDSEKVAVALVRDLGF